MNLTDLERNAKDLVNHADAVLTTDEERRVRQPMGRHTGFRAIKGVRHVIPAELVRWGESQVQLKSRWCRSTRV